MPILPPELRTPTPPFVKRRVGIPCTGCGKTHKTWYRLAHCRFRRHLAWVEGDPPADGPCWAVVSYCGRGHYGCDHVTVSLWATQGEAKESKRLVDEMGCGGACSRRHPIYNLAAESH